MLNNIDSMIEAVKISQKAIKARSITTEFYIYINEKDREIKIHIDVCATYIYLDGKRISKKNINELLREG